MREGSVAYVVVVGRCEDEAELGVRGLAHGGAQEVVVDGEVVGEEHVQVGREQDEGRVAGVPQGHHRAADMVAHPETLWNTTDVGRKVGRWLVPVSDLLDLPL